MLAFTGLPPTPPAAQASSSRAHGSLHAAARVPAQKAQEVLAGIVRPSKVTPAAGWSKARSSSGHAGGGANASEFTLGTGTLLAGSRGARDGASTGMTLNYLAKCRDCFVSSCWWLHA